MAKIAGTFAAVGALAGAIKEGTSLINASLHAFETTKRDICCGIHVENWTRFVLNKAELYTNEGEIPSPPGIILPAKREAMVATNNKSTNIGTFGTVSWRVEGLDRRIVVMWHVPRANDDSNCLSVGITDIQEHDATWYGTMMNGNSNKILTFKTGVYGKKIVDIEIEDQKIQVIGTMGSTKRIQALITIRPKLETDYAYSITKALHLGEEVTRRNAHHNLDVEAATKNALEGDDSEIGIQRKKQKV